MFTPIEKNMQLLIAVAYSTPSELQQIIKQATKKELNLFFYVLKVNLKIKSCHLKKKTTIFLQKLKKKEKKYLFLKNKIFFRCVVRNVIKSYLHDESFKCCDRA